jgi:hypothetical protein
MTEEQQRIAIAEACGWREILWSQLTNPREARENKWYCRSNAQQICGWIPSYTADLNAMHEAEKVFADDDLFRGYEAQLDKVVPMSERWIFATAAQRAEAFLKTLNLWKI